MDYLAILWPGSADKRYPLSRDQLVLLLVAVNQLFLGLETLLTHGANGTIRWNEWIPIYSGFIAGILLFIAGLLARNHRHWSVPLATFVFIGSLIVGIMGTVFHLSRGLLPDAAFGERVSISLMVWAPPVLAPLAFAGVALIGLSAAYEEDPIDSGRLHMGRGVYVNLPLNKTRAYFLLVSLGILAALISSVFDHARSGFENPWLWLPLFVATFATVVAALMVGIDDPSRREIVTYSVTMLILIATGVLGSFLHIQADLVQQNQFVLERFLRNAPFLAPMLFANMGLFGLVTLLRPDRLWRQRAELAASAQPQAV
jgi:uncharacterized membrane protein (UPF0136 family)